MYKNCSKSSNETNKTFLLWVLVFLIEQVAAKVAQIIYVYPLQKLPGFLFQKTH